LYKLITKQITKHWQTNFSLLIGALIFAFVLCEFFLRLLGFSYPIFHKPDDITGRISLPNAEGWFSKEGNAYIKINSDGLRDREHPKIKPEKVIRIAILGDSFTEALHVNLENTFWSILEKKLNANKTFGNKKVEVINFGVSGFGTDQELMTLRHRVWDYSPDIVLLAFYSGNDIRNNSKILEPYKLKPFFVLRNEKLEFDNSFIDHPTYKWKTGFFWSTLRALYPHTRIFQLFAKFREIDFSFRLNSNNGNQALFDYLYHTIFFAPINTDWKQAWEITEKLLIKMRNEVEEKNARFVLVVLSNDIQVHPDAEVRQHFIEEMDIFDLYYPDKRIKDFAKKEGIEVLLLAPDFQRYAEKNNVFLHGIKNSPSAGFGHWNVEGHRLAGEIIAEYFCSDGI
jgi:hypothetical protein